MWSNLWIQPRLNSHVNQETENLISMICLNPVTEVDDSVKRGLVPMRTDLEQLLGSDNFKEILRTDATTEEGQIKVAEYFHVGNLWDSLLKEWADINQNVTGFKRYYELLFLVKSKSHYDKVWFSFFEGMHRHAAIVAGLVCSKFNHSTNELDPGSLTLDDFRNEGIIKSFRDPGTTVEEHLDMIMKKKIDAPMFENVFHLSAYIPKWAQGAEQDAGKLIEGAKLQSLWISNFKLNLATTTLSKNIVKWLQTTLQHSTKET